MKKVMLLAAVMAMVLAAAAPAFAQATAVGGNVQYADCDQIQAAVTAQYNTGNQQNAAGVAQELGVSQNQVLACLGSIAAGRNVNINTASPAATATASDAPESTWVITACHPDYVTCVGVEGNGSGHGRANDLNCGSIGEAVKLRRIGVDPYRLDADGDGIGCQSS